MKKILLVTCLFAVILGVLSCSKDETNPLVGTKWGTAFGNLTIVLEFTSNTEVQGYFTNNNAYYCGMSKGTYSLNGYEITFNNLEMLYTPGTGKNRKFKLQTGSIDGNQIQTNGQCTAKYSITSWEIWNTRFNRQ